MDKLEIREFDTNMLTHDCTIYIYGRRRSGKSWLVKDLLFAFRRIPKGIIFSETENSTPVPCLKDCIPSTFIHDEYRPHIVQKLMESQSEKMKRIPDGKSTIETSAFVIMDDMMAQSSMWKKDTTIKRVLLNGRHYGILYICTSQHVLGLDPALRANFDWIFIARDDNLSNRKKLYEHFASIIPTFQLFKSLMDKCTEDHRFLVLKTCGTSNNWQDNVFFYKSKSHPPFRVGNKSFWNFHQTIEGSNEKSDGIYVDLRTNK
jgi:hypothetical protein